MKIALKLPRLSMNMDEATLVAWLKQPGETFVTGDPLYTIETEKVSSEIEAPCDGLMVELVAAAGENLAVGSIVCRIEMRR